MSACVWRPYLVQCDAKLRPLGELRPCQQPQSVVPQLVTLKDGLVVCEDVAVELILLRARDADLVHATHFFHLQQVAVDDARELAVDVRRRIHPVAIDDGQEALD